MERTGNEFCIMFLQTSQTKDDSNLLYTAQQLKNNFFFFPETKPFFPETERTVQQMLTQKQILVVSGNAFPCLETAMSCITCTSYHWICGLGNTGSLFCIFLNLPHLLLNRKKSNKASLTKKRKM